LVLTSILALKSAKCMAPTLWHIRAILYVLLFQDILQLHTHEQDRQCIYSTALRHVCANVSAVEKQEVLKNSKCVFVALGIQHAMRMHHLDICGLPSSTVFIHTIS
jgi:hypothetical protein